MAGTIFVVRNASKVVKEAASGDDVEAMIS